MNLSADQYSVCWSPEEFRIYKIGHRDARHAAAELVNKQDAVVVEALDMLDDLINTLANYRLLQKKTKDPVGHQVTTTQIENIKHLISKMKV